MTQELLASRSDSYRDLLEAWTAWWNGPGRRDYHGNVLPPLTKTAEALKCMVCAGISEHGERCAACGRAM